jgi:hypothetical protein
VPISDPDYRIPVVLGVPPDLYTALAAHVVGGVGLLPHYRSQRSSSARLETTPEALGRRSATSRAIASLLKRGMLAYRPCHWDHHGFVLTSAGLAAGLSHEPAIADLERRLWLLHKSRRTEEHPNWWLSVDELLPSPPVDLAAE